MVLHGRKSSDGVTSVWHWAHPVSAWVDAPYVASSTYSETVSPSRSSRKLRVGVAAEAVLVRRAGVVEDTSDLVGGVAIHADRNLVGFRLPQPALDHLPVHVLDQRMTLGAGPHHVPLVDAGTRIGVRQNEVRRMARRAHRGDRQALSEQTLAVDRLRVVLEDPILRDVALP